MDNDKTVTPIELTMMKVWEFRTYEKDNEIKTISRFRYDEKKETFCITLTLSHIVKNQVFSRKIVSAQYIKDPTKAAEAYNNLLI